MQITIKRKLLDTPVNIPNGVSAPVRYDEYCEVTLKDGTVLNISEHPTGKLTVEGNEMLILKPITPREVQIYVDETYN